MTADLALVVELVSEYGAFPVLAAWFHRRLQTVESDISALRSHLIATDGGEDGE